MEIHDKLTGRFDDLLDQGVCQVCRETLDWDVDRDEVYADAECCGRVYGVYPVLYECAVEKYEEDY